MAEKLSCLCASQVSRWGCLARALSDFENQTYAEKELIVVVGSDNYASQINSHVSEMGYKSSIKVFYRPTCRTAQEGYLFAAAQATGNYITFWDDENMNHPMRLKFQMEQQTPDRVTGLQQGLYYFPKSKILSVVDTTKHTNGPVSIRYLISTLIYPRDTMPAIDSLVRSKPAQQIADLLPSRKILLMPVKPKNYGLHVVSVTGNNVRPFDAHWELASTSSLTLEELKALKPGALALDEYRWLDSFDVEAYDGKFSSHQGLNRWPDDFPKITLGDELVTKISA